MKAVVSLLCLFAAACQAATPWEFCKGFSSSSNIGVASVVVPGCNSAPCVLKKGSSPVINITFKANTNMTDIQNGVYGHIAGIDVPFPGFPASQVDVCSLLKVGGPCPFKKGTTYVEAVVLPVSSSFPSITTVAKWKLNDQDSKEQGCFQIPVKLES